LILKEDYGIEVEYITIKDDYSLDMDDLSQKLDDRVKIVSLAHVSNTTGQFFDLENVNSLLSMRYGNDRPLFIVDGSQSVPHFAIDVKKIGCDAMFFTGHKVFADSGIGVLWAKEELLNTLKPIFSGGGAIGRVEQETFTHSTQLPDKFEPGTPNLSGAVSLLKAFEYIESIGGYEKLEQIEQELVDYTLEKLESISEIKLLG
jgi:cysteine desulfurase/selenocysteine lyase